MRNNVCEMKVVEKCLILSSNIFVYFQFTYGVSPLLNNSHNKTPKLHTSTPKLRLSHVLPDLVENFPKATLSGAAHLKGIALFCFL